MSWAVSVFENGKLYQRIQYPKRHQSVLFREGCFNSFEGHSNGRRAVKRAIQYKDKNKALNEFHRQGAKYGGSKCHEVELKEVSNG